MAGSDPIFIPPALHELESEVMAEVWGRGLATVRAEAEVGTLVERYGDAALVHFARRMDQRDPERRHQLNDLAHRA